MQIPCRSDIYESNDTRATARSVAVTTHIGLWACPDDDDWFRIRAGRGERLQVVCHSFPPGSTALPVIQLFSPDREEIMTLRSVEFNDGTCHLDWAAPEAGEYPEP